jgi:alpha-D-xyloside xylohydrolase
MDEVTRAFLLAPPAVLDPTRSIDRYVAVAPAPGAEAGGVVVTTESGARLVGTITTPQRGVVRVRLATDEAALAPSPSPMLAPGLEDRPASVGAIDGGVEADVAGARFRWLPMAGGFGFGAAAEGPETFTVIAGHTWSGLLRRGELHVGWVQTARIGPDDAVFGGGECFQGPDLRGRVRRCVNAEVYGAAGQDLSYLTVPLLWSDAGWGVYVHSGAPVVADVGSSHAQVVALDVPGPVLDVFWYLGTPAEILAAHHHVTGLPGAFPEWAYGVWTSRASYLSAAEVDEVLEGYAAAECPVDVVHLDWWQKGYMAELTTSWEVDRERWPEGWGPGLAERGVRLSLWHNPYLYTGTPIAAEAEELLLRDDAGELVETSDIAGRHVIDFTHPGTSSWWRDKIVALVRSEGVSSMKPDFAEEVPPAARLHDGRTGWEARNEYAVRYQHETHAALREALGDDAVALFCRSGTAGAQRYPCHWVGDTPSTWDGMASALRACLSLSLSGFAFVASDVGGFWGTGAFDTVMKAFAEMDGSSFTADVDPELFARWTQWGALSPVMRFHGLGRREPWAYPSPFGDAAVEACRLRHRLAPYLTAAGHEASTVGTPMARPMVLAFPGDRGARDAHLQYLLGPDVLVAPVLTSGGHVRLWVPPGEWHGLQGAPTIAGPNWTELTLDLFAVPAWSKTGSA